MRTKMLCKKKADTHGFVTVERSFTVRKAEYLSSGDK